MDIEHRRAEIVKLLNHFKGNGISHDAKTGLNLVLKFQDLIGQANITEIKDIESKLSEELQKTFIWACFSCLGEDMAVDIYTKTAGRRKLLKIYHEEHEEIDLQFKEIDKRFSEINAESLKLLQEKKAFYENKTRIQDAESMNRMLERENLNLKSALKDCHAELEDYEVLKRVLKNLNK